MEKAVNEETVLPPWGLGSCDEFNRFNASVNRNRLGDSTLQMGWPQFRNSKSQQPTSRRIPSSKSKDLMKRNGMLVLGATLEVGLLEFGASVHRARHHHSRRLRSRIPHHQTCFDLVLAT